MSLGSPEILEIATSELTYLPTPEQRKAKSAFWARFNENPICDPSQISLSIALRFAGDNRISRWWPQTGFREWFQNSDEFRQRLEYLANLALDSIEHILADPRAQASAKVTAAKLVMEVARKMPPKHQAEKYADEKIGEMDRKQLEEFISRRISLLPAKKQVTTSDSEDTISEDGSVCS